MNPTSSYDTRKENDASVKHQQKRGNTGGSVKPVKALGQHFLIDKLVIARLMESAELCKDDAVLEIGPGTGNLTKWLAKLSRVVVAVEKDRRMAEILTKSLDNYDNVIIFVEDILELDYSVLSGISNVFKVVANIPYNISTPLLMRFIEPLVTDDRMPLRIEEMVLLVQKEVAMRLTALPGTKQYGVLTVAAGLHSDTEIIFNVPPESFHPRPAVQSSVIRIRPYLVPRYELIDKQAFYTTVRAAFEQRRKTVLNALCGSRHFNSEKYVIADVLSKCGIEGSHRGETLTILQFVELANSFFSLGLIN